MNSRPFELAFLGLCAAAASVLIYQRWPSPPSDPAPPHPIRQAASDVGRKSFHNRTDLLLYLKNNERAGIFDELKPDDQDVLIGLVRGHCRESYDGDSCVHYVITCGNPCLAHISNEDRERMVQHYQDRRKQMGLPAME